MKMTILEEFQKLREHIENLEAENQDLTYKLKCRDDKLAEARAQVEKMKRCFNCSKWFSHTEFCVSNERGTSICDKWEPAK